MAFSISQEDLEKTITLVDNVIQHLKQQGEASKQDVEQLKAIIFHLDGLLVRLQNNADAQTDLITQDVTRLLSTAVEHLRDVLKIEENSDREHADDAKQVNNDSLFASLLKHIQQL